MMRGASFLRMGGKSPKPSRDQLHVGSDRGVVALSRAEEACVIANSWVLEEAIEAKDQRSSDKQILPVAAFGQGRQKRRRVGRSQPHPEGVNRLNERRGLGGVHR